MRVAAPAYRYEETEYRTGDDGREHPVTVPYMSVDCARCGNHAVVFGHSDDSYEAACCILRNSCQKRESNFYAEP